MPRPRAALRRARTTVLAAVLGGLLTTLAVVVPAPATAGGNAEEQAPLALTITSLNPSALRPKDGGTVAVTGTVTNTDDEPWLDVALYPFASTTPMTTTAELAEAARTPETVEVGPRLLQEQVKIGELQPGQVVSYTLIVPRADLPREPGVYWFGVHALGSGPEGDDGHADGRARTFLPVVSGKAAPVRAAVLVPVRARVARNPDGSIATLDGWRRLLSPAGRLGRLRTLGTTTGAGSLSWLVDPALLDALRQLAADNPQRDISPTEAPADGTATDSASPTPTPSESAKPQPKPDEETRTVAALASGWLDSMVPVLKESEVLALPYGDLDLPAAADHDPDMYGTARTRSIAFFEDLDIPATQVNAPPRGVTSATAVMMTDSSTPTVLADTALPDELAWGTEASPAVVNAGQWRIAVSSSEAASGGPGPGNPQADVPLRQRVLAEAAVRAIDPARSPLVVTMPERWRLADPLGFVSGLSQPWLQLSGLTAAMAGQIAPSIDTSALHYPASAAREELGGDRFVAAEALIRSGRTLQRVLARNDTVASEVVDEALTTVGYPARAGASSGATSSRSWIETQLGSIRVEGPSAVTLSGSSGRFAATVVNGLDEPVTVAIHPLSDPGIRISAPRSVQVSASSRMTVLLNARQAQAGVHNVTLQLVDSDDVHIGASAYVPIRAAQVSKIIWLFLGVGGALLFGAIVVRLVRRIRAARAPGEPDPDTPAERTEGSVHADD